MGAASAATTTYSYDVNDRLLTETTDGAETRYTYDDNGNTLTKTIAADVVEYAYDDANRLIEMRKAGERVGYVYNADGLRVRRTIMPLAGMPTTMFYVQDNAYPYGEVVEEWTQQSSGAMTLAATYAHADDLISQTRYSTAGVPTTSFVQADGFGSTRWLTDASGAVTDSVAYDAFGTDMARSGTTNVEHLYRGERWDANVALYDLRARLYNAGNGRFLTQDSFAGFGSDPRSLHKYIYGNTDPINTVDPSGHFGMQDLMAGIRQIGTMLRLSMPTIRTAGKRLINAPKFAVYKGRKTVKAKMGANGIGRFVPHYFVYVESLLTPGFGWRYDVGEMNPEDYFGSLVDGELHAVTGGFIQKNKTTRAAMAARKDKIDAKPVAMHGVAHHMLWETTAYKPFVEGFNYCVIGTNCASWTLMALGEARAIAKLPLKP